MFNHSTSGGHHFPNVGLNKMKQIQPSYFEEGGWLRHVGILVLFAKASRAILNHASIEDVFSIVITRVLDLAISNRDHISRAIADESPINRKTECWLRTLILFYLTTNCVHLDQQLHIEGADLPCLYDTCFFSFSLFILVSFCSLIIRDKLRLIWATLVCMFVKLDSV